MMTLKQAILFFGCEDTPPQDQLQAAIKIAARWREDGPTATAALIKALYDQGLTWHDIEHMSTQDNYYINASTARRLVRRIYNIGDNT